MSIQQALVQTRGDVFAAALLVEVMASAYYDNDPNPNMGTDSKDSSRRIQKSAQARKLYIEMYNFYARKLEEFGVKTIKNVNATTKGFKAWIEEKNVELAQYDDREAMTAKLRELGITNMKEVIEIYCQFNVIKWLAEYQLFLTRLAELKELRLGIMRKTGKLFVRQVQEFWEASEEKQELDEYFEKVKAIEKMAVSANMPGASPRESVGSQDAEMSQADQGPSSNVAGSDDDPWGVPELPDEQPKELSKEVLGYLGKLPFNIKAYVYFRDPAGNYWEYDALDEEWISRLEESLDSTKETIRLQEESGQTWGFVSEDGSFYSPPFSPSPPQSPAKESRQEPKELSDVELTSLNELPEPGKVYFRAEDRNFWALDPVLDKWVPRSKGSLVLTKKKIYLLLDNVGQPLGFYKVDDDELFYDPLAPKPWEQQGQQERQRQPEKKRLRQWGKEREQQRERGQEEIARRLGMDRGAIEEEERRRREREQEDERRQQQQEEGEERRRREREQEEDRRQQQQEEGEELRRRGGRKRLRRPDSGRRQSDQGLDLEKLLDEEEREPKQIVEASPSSPRKKKSSSSGTPRVDLTGTDDTGAFRPRDEEARVDAWLQELPKLVTQGNAVYFRDQKGNFSIKSASGGWSSSKVEPAYAFKIIIDEKGPMFEPLWVNDKKIQRESPGHMLMLEILKAQLRSFKKPVLYRDMGENIKAFVDPVFLDEQSPPDDYDTFSVGEQPFPAYSISFPPPSVQGECDIEDTEKDAIDDQVGRATKGLIIYGFPVLNLYKISQKVLLDTLQGEWLTNDVIDSYLTLVQFYSAVVNDSKTAVLNTNAWKNFVSKDKVKITMEQGILENDTVIVPQHHPSHFTIVVLKPQERKWFLYDSLYYEGMFEEVKPVIDRMIHFFQLNEGKDPTVWEGDQISVPQQGDGSNCGVFAVRFAVFAMFDMVPDFNWSDEDKVCFRYQIVNDILNRSFSG